MKRLSQIHGSDSALKGDWNDKEKNQTVKILKIPLTEFSGDPIRWSKFSVHFETAVDQQPIAEVQKLNPLLRCLKGLAERTGDRYAVTGENYGVTVDLLKLRFGNSEWIRHELYKELTQLRCGNGKHLRGTMEEIERILRQLKNMGVDVNHPHLSGKTEGTDGKIIRVSRAEFHPQRTTRATGYWTQPPSSNFPVITQKRNTLGIVDGKKSCVFCGRNHWNDQCGRYATVPHRGQRIMEMRLCLKCFKARHMSNQCQKNIRCFLCRMQHNSALCRIRRTKRIQSNNDNAERATTKERSIAENEAEQAVGADTDEKWKPTIVSTISMGRPRLKNMNIRSNVTENGKQVVLLWCRKILTRECQGLAFSDSRRWQSSITEKLDREPGVRGYKEPTLAVGDKRPKTYRSNKLNIEIKEK